MPVLPCRLLVYMLSRFMLNLSNPGRDDVLCHGSDVVSSRVCDTVISTHVSGEVNPFSVKPEIGPSGKSPVVCGAHACA